MALKKINPSDPLPERNVVMILYGQPGVYKSSLAQTAADPVTFDFDDGLDRCVGRKNAYRIDSWRDMDEAMKTDLIGQEGYKTVIIDTVESCMDKYMANFLIEQDHKNGKAGGALSLAGYGSLKALFNTFLNYVLLKKVDVILIAHTKEETGAGDIIKNKPKVTGGTYDIIIARADMIGYMETVNNKSTIDFNPTDRYIGKNTAEFKRLELPHYTSEAWPTYMGDLIGKVKDAMQRQTSEQTAALELFAQIKSDIDLAESPEDFDAIVTLVAPMTAVYKEGLRKLMLEKMAEAGVEYDKDSKSHKLKEKVA